MNDTKLFTLETNLVRPQLNGNSSDKAAVEAQSKSVSAEYVTADSKNIADAVQLSIKPASIARLLGAMASGLVLASIAVLLMDYLTGYSSIFIHKLVKLFYVELELNVPAYFSALLLISAALLLALITTLKKIKNEPYVLHWAILSFGFLFMSFDETASIHERLIEPMRAILGEQNLGILYFAWVVPAIAIILVLGIFFLKFLLNLPKKTRLSFIIAATVYLGAAVGLELIEGKHSEIYGKENLTYIILTTVEEALEMFGTIGFIWALLEYLADNYKQVRLRFDDFLGD